MNSPIRCFWSFVVTVALLPSLGFGMASSGFSNEAVAPEALGQYNCVTAQADGPSAVFFNPAGLAQLDGWRLSTSDTMLDIHTQRASLDGQTTRGTTDLLHAPSLFIARGDQPHRLGYGVGLYAPFGLETAWDSNSFARYSGTLSRLDIAMITPAIAYKFSPELQVGLGVDIALATDVDLRKRVDVTAINGARSPDGDSRQQATGHGVGMNAGVRFAPTPRQAIGLTYRSAIDLPLDGTQRLSGLSGPAAFVFGGTSYETGAHARITLPQTVIVGYAFSVTPRWRLESDLQWTDWTSIDSFHASFDEADATRQSILQAGIDPLHRDWEAVLSMGLGSEYALNDNWTLRGGAGYAWAAVPESSFDPGLPDANRFELTAGFSRRLFRDTLLNVAYNGVFFNQRTVSNSVDSGRINGTYDTVIHVYSVGVEQKF
jgi:long-chain fatty acid transport protein